MQQQKNQMNIKGKYFFVFITSSIQRETIQASF